MLPHNVDHLVYVAPDLEAGMDLIEARIGQRPLPGGRHKNWGTQNALLSIGDKTYLEVLAPDPLLPAPARGRLTDATGPGPNLLTWVIRTSDIDKFAESARAAGAGIGNVESGRRERFDGSLLRWKVSDPYVLPLNGAIPFVIDWGETPHPAGSLTRAGTLVSLAIEHPDPEEVKNMLQALGVEMLVREGASYRLVAIINTDKGIVELD